MNPILSIRTSAGLNRREFAILLGVSTVCVQHAEVGITANPKRILVGLAREGFDVRSVSRDYFAWRKLQAEAIRLRKRDTLARLRSLHNPG